MTSRINSDEKQHRTTGQYDLSSLSPDTRHRCSRVFSPSATSAFLSRVVLEYSTPRVVAFDMKKTLDSFMDSVSQKQLTEAQSKALSDRFNDALEKSLAEYQQQHHVVILVSPAVVQGAPDVTRNIQHDIARRMKGEQ